MNDLLEFNKLADKFAKAVLKGKKLAGKKVGREYVTKRRQSLERQSKRRKKAVISRVGKEQGTLIVYDMAPMAVSQEFGEVITPKDSAQLFVRVSKLKAGEKPVRRGDYLFATRSGAEPRLIGVYKDNVTIKKATPSKSFFRQIEGLFDSYEKELIKQIDEKDILL